MQLLRSLSRLCDHQLHVDEMLSLPQSGGIDGCTGDARPQLVQLRGECAGEALRSEESELILPRAVVQRASERGEIRSSAEHGVALQHELCAAE